MALGRDLIATMRQRDWRPIDVEADGERLEVFPLRSQVGAGFTLWAQAPDGAWSVQTTGHTRNGILFEPSGDPMTLPDALTERIDALLQRVQG